MPATASASVARIKDVNVRYHDAAAASYDAKWGIDFGATGQGQVRAKLTKALGRWPERPYEHGLEIGAGTGYFSLNLLQLGVIERATATDISPGMLDALGSSARRLALDVSTVEADAEQLPFEDRSFDLVFGHAVLHHVPRLEGAFRELHRVLRPGGALAFCGEPSRYGDLVAAVPKASARAAAPLWRRAVGVPARRSAAAEAGQTTRLEREVDVHAFAPGRLRQLLEASGFAAVRIRGDELLSSMYGWMLRAWESTADPDRVPWAWQSFALRSYLALQRLDAALLEPRLPSSLFYNLVLSARRVD
ncbi:MAG TPA: methyltransferase domain-containing protein [Solirubrobacterales bacterium]|nr:methyltransferase domain-containing protein [Solirubrobacterales bacterium]